MNSLKPLLFISVLFLYQLGFSQDELPTNNLLLSKIFESSIKDSTYTRAATENEMETFDDRDSLTYQVVFKEIIRLNHEKYLIVIIQAEYGSQHGHQFGNTGIYFFQSNENDLFVTDSIVVNMEPIGISGEFDICKIGLKNQALMWTFESSGNQHYEKNISFHLLEPGKLTHLFTVDSEYSNIANVSSGNKDEPCEGFESEETYAIRTSDAEWFDVIVERREFEFENGCLERFQSKKFIKKLSFKNGRYIEE